MDVVSSPGELNEDEETVTAEKFGRIERGLADGQDPPAFLPVLSAMSCSSQAPRLRQAGGRTKGQLVSARQAERPMIAPRTAPGFSCTFVWPQARPISARPARSLFESQALERSRANPNGERPKAAADRRVAGDERMEPRLRPEISSGTTRVGDGDEVAAGVRRARRSATTDKGIQSATVSAVVPDFEETRKTVVAGFSRVRARWMASGRRIQDAEVEPARLGREHGGEDLGREAGAAMPRTTAVRNPARRSESAHASRPRTCPAMDHGASSN